MLGPDGRPVAEIFVGFSGDRRHRVWILTGRDGAFAIRAPQGALSLLKIEVPPCDHVGFYNASGFTTLESEASRLELGATDVTGIEIRLPASPAELCRRQPTVLGGPRTPRTRSGLPSGGLQFPPG